MFYTIVIINWHIRVSKQPLFPRTEDAIFMEDKYSTYQTHVIFTCFMFIYSMKRNVLSFLYLVLLLDTYVFVG